jgi:hypothetical protein
MIWVGTNVQYIYYIKDQQDATLAVCLLVTARLLYMFRTLSASIIRSTKNCISSHWCVSWVGMIYRVSQEERSIFCEVIVSIILGKNLCMNMCPILKGFRGRSIWLYSGLAWALSIVFPSRPAAPLSEECESVKFSNIYYKLYQLCHLNNKYRY